MSYRKWTKRKVVNALVRLYDRGVKLRTYIVSREDSGLYGAIYDQREQGRFFSSFGDAIDQTIAYLHRRGRVEDAEALRRDTMDPRQAHLDSITARILDGRSLQGATVRKEDKHLWKGLEWYYGNYYKGLAEAKRLLEKSGNVEAAKRAEVSNWKDTEVRKKQKPFNAEKKRRALEGILVITPEDTYHNGDIPLFSFDGTLTGEQVYEKLEASEEWLFPQEFSKRTGVTHANVHKTVMHHVPDRIIRYEGKKTKILIHRSALDFYQRKLKRRIAENSVSGVAARFDVPRHKINYIMRGFGIFPNPGNGNQQVLFSEEEVGLIRRALKRGVVIKRKILAAISPEKDYSFSELELAGIPVAPFLRRVERGEIPYRTEGNKGKRLISGKYVSEYFREHIDSMPINNSLRLLTFFYPHLHTTSDLIQELQQIRGVVSYKLKVLLEESPNSCFRIRKSDDRSKIIVTDETVPILREWNRRNSLQLLSAINLAREFPDKVEVERALGDLEGLISHDSVKREDFGSAFEVFGLLGRFQKMAVPIGQLEIQKRDLRILCNYMRSWGYSSVDFDPNLSMEELEERVGDASILDRVVGARSRLGFALYTANEKLMFKVMQKMGVDFDSFLLPAQEGLTNAIELFDYSRGYKFSTYAWKAIQRRIDRERDRRVDSLYRPVGDEAKVIDFVEAESDGKIENLEISEAERQVRSLLDILNPREKQVIERRFGLNGQVRTELRVIGRDMGVSGEMIRQIEKKALEKLSKDPRAGLLRDILL